MEWVVAAGLLIFLTAPAWLFLLARVSPPVKLFLAGRSRWSRCWMGLHKWSMPGGCCERCGLCDRFFGGHDDCGKTCQYWTEGKP